MYVALLFAHSLGRWLVLLSLLYATIRGYQGYALNLAFTKVDNSVRHWTATLAHIQLLLGATLYFQSPVVRAFFANTGEAIRHRNTAFFGVIHIGFMFVAFFQASFNQTHFKDRE